MVWWQKPVIQALEKQNQKDYKHKANLGYIERHCFEEEEEEKENQSHINILQWVTTDELEAPRKSVNAWWILSNTLFGSEPIGYAGGECWRKGEAMWQGE